MAGIYLHIPFCKQACHYCNFHFSTTLRAKADLVAALQIELTLRAPELAGQTVASVYFGGGTPSLLSEAELAALFTTLTTHYAIAADAEITLEANPDDITPAALASWRALPINRLSIGIQSFAEADLQFMNRAHNAREARSCLDRAYAAGFTDLTADLIYGCPTTSDAQWAENLRLIGTYELPHLSCYALTLEPRTALAHFVKTGQAAPPDDDQAARHFDYLQAWAAERGYEHYEISNFALPGRYSRHNTSYWRGVPYLGIGPAAHGFDGRAERRWNVANNAAYIRGWRQMETAPAAERPLLAAGLFDTEQLTPTDRYNETVMTGLRTQWGVRLAELRAIGSAYAEYFLRTVAPLVQEKTVRREAERFYLAPEHRFLADGIAAELFYE
jgi:oxygen-independent coproporphyrinogen-3 oxidase